MADHAEIIETAKRVLQLSAKATSEPWESRDSELFDGKVVGPPQTNAAFVGKARDTELVIDYRTSAPQLAGAVIAMAAEIEGVRKSVGRMVLAADDVIADYNSHYIDMDRVRAARIRIKSSGGMAAYMTSASQELKEALSRPPTPSGEVK